MHARTTSTTEPLRRARGLLRALTGVGFLVVLAAPGLDSAVSRVEAAGVRSEQRAAHARPPLPRDLRQLERWPERFDAWFADTFGLREALVAAHNRLRWFVLGESPTERLVVGDEGWVFYCEDSPVTNLRAPPPFGETQLATWVRALGARRDWMRERGGEYVFALVPDKSTLYAERLPQRFHPVRRTRREQLFEALAGRDDVLALDLLAPLRAELAHDTADDTTFSRYGTHWTERGALVGYRDILGALQPRWPELEPWPREEFAPAPGQDDHDDSWSGRLYLKGQLAESFFRYEPRRPRRAERDTSVELPHRGMHFRHPDRDLPRAVVLHDSFGPYVVPNLAEHFSDTWSYWRAGFAVDLIERHDPDVVIQIQVERSLHDTPPALSQDLSGAFLAERFERSRDALLRLGPRELPRALVAEGATRFEPGAEGLAVTTRSPADLFSLPEVALPADGSGVLRLDLTREAAGPLVVLYRTRRAPTYHHDRAYELHLPAGRSVVHLQLAAADQLGSLRVRPGREPGRFVLHALELRACDLR